MLSIAGLGLLLWAIIEAPTEGWTSGSVIGVGLASLAVLGTFVAWEARSRHPMLKLGLFSDRRFSVAAAGESLGTFGLLGALFVQTQFLQFDLGYSPLQAGLRILPIAAVLVRERAAVSGRRPPHRGQVHRRRRPGGDRGRSVADLGGVHGCHDLWGRGARHAADRARGRPPAADRDELRRGLGPPGRLRDRVSDPTPWPSRSVARSASP